MFFRFSIRIPQKFTLKSDFIASRIFRPKFLKNSAINFFPIYRKSSDKHQLFPRAKADGLGIRADFFKNKVLIEFVHNFKENFLKNLSPLL